MTAPAARQASDFEIVGEFGQTGEGPAYLARDRSTGELVAVRPADPEGNVVAVIQTLNSAVPATPVSCPICRIPVTDWRRFCGQCGADLSGVDVAPEGLEARRVFEDALRSAERPVDLIGPMKRSEGGGDVWFGRDRQTGEILALNLTRGGPLTGPGRAFDIAVTAVMPARGTARPDGSPAAAPGPRAPDESGEEVTAGAAQVKLCPSCHKTYTAAIRFCPDDGSVLRLSDAADSLIGAIIAGRYLIQRKIGQGGMGQVYVAEHVRMGRQCAIKVLSRELSNDVQAVSRFAREATNASRINDVHVAHIYDFGETPEHGVYLAMEFVDGQPLGKLVADGGPLPGGRAIAIAVQVATALEAAHAEGVIHRDLTPNNIMIGRAHDGSDMVKVVDFGIAKATEDLGSGLTRTGFVIGTPQYMSPEQFVGGSVDARSDIFQLGCLLFEMLTARPPFGTASGAGQIARRLTAPAPDPRVENPSVAPVLSDVVRKALAVGPDERYQSAVEMRGALTSALAGSRAAPPSAVPDATDREPRPEPDATIAAGGTDASLVTGPKVARATDETRLGPAAAPADVPGAAKPGPAEAETILQTSPVGPPALSRSTPVPGVRPPARAKPRRPPRAVVLGVLGLVAVPFAVTAWGTFVKPVRVGPITFGFGGSVAATPAIEVPATLPPPPADPVAGERPATPAGIRLGAALPSGALVRVDGVVVSVREEFIALAPGSHEVEIALAGFVPARNRLTIEDAQQVPWTPRFERIEVGADPPPGRAAVPRPPESGPGSVRDSRTASDPAPVATETRAPAASFTQAAGASIEAFRRSLEAKDLDAIRKYLTQTHLREFEEILRRSGSSPIRVAAYGIDADSAGARAMFFLRIDQGETVLMDVKEFSAELIRNLSGAWQLFTVQRKQ